ncbi:MAG: hypothetical protein AB1515_08710 [Nitrospirota bacterium]
MDWSVKPWRAAGALLILVAALSRPAWADPPAAAELEHSRAELSAILERQRALENRAIQAHVEEEQLGGAVQELKRRSPLLPEALHRLRLDRALRQLRDRLLELQSLHREQQGLRADEERIRERIHALLRAQANERLTEAERLYRAGRELQAEAAYGQSLELMEESERIVRPAIPSLPPQSPPFDPELTGQENPAELFQISVLLQHQAEELVQESTYLERIAGRLRSDLEWERRAARFQGIRERGAGGQPKPGPIEPELVLAGRLAEIERRIESNDAAIRQLRARAEEVSRLAGADSSTSRSAP